VLKLRDVVMVVAQQQLQQYIGFMLGVPQVNKMQCVICSTLLLLCSAQGSLMFCSTTCPVPVPSYSQRTRHQDW
jgi:hypothetical protein